MTIILDTSVVSEFMKPDINENVLAWWKQARGQEFKITAVTKAELLYGVNRQPSAGRSAVVPAFCGWCVICPHSWGIPSRAPDLPVLSTGGLTGPGILRVR